MAVSFDATGANLSNNIASFSWSHTTSGSLADMYLIVWLCAHDAANQNNITGVTHDGVAMTKIANDSSGQFSAWSLASPNTGTKTITVTKPSGADHFQGMSQSFAGVKQTTTWTLNSNYKLNSAGNNAVNTVNTLTVASSSMMASCDFFIDSGFPSFANLGYNGTRDQNDTANASSAGILFACGHESTGTATSTWTATGGAAPFLAHNQFALVLDETPPNPAAPDRYFRRLQAVQRAASW